MTRTTLPIALLALTLSLTGAIALTPTSHAAASSVDTTRWQLNFSAGSLRMHVDDLTGQAYWYFTYEVVNRTGQDRFWAPRMTLFTDTGKIVQSGQDVPSRVERDLIRLINNPYMVSQNQAIGQIRQGQENAIDSIAIWPVDSVEVTELTIFIAGVSSETSEIQHPITGQSIIEQRTIRRDYIVPGDAGARGSRPVELVNQEWIMR